MPTIIIQLAHKPVPDSEKSSRAPDLEKIPLETKVRDMLDLIESGHESAVEWITINKIFRHLKGRTDKRSKDILAMIRPVMAKYGQHDVAIK